MTVEALMASMTGAEFDQWWQFHLETPIDDESVHHLPLGKFAAMYFNMHRDPKSSSQRLTIRECMPWFELGDFGADYDNESQDIGAKLSAFATMHNEALPG